MRLSLSHERTDSGLAAVTYKGMKVRGGMTGRAFVLSLALSLVVIPARPESIFVMK